MGGVVGWREHVGVCTRVSEFAFVHLPHRHASQAYLHLPENRPPRAQLKEAKMNWAEPEGPVPGQGPNRAVFLCRMKAHCESWTHVSLRLITLPRAAKPRHSKYPQIPSFNPTPNPLGQFLLL